MMYPLLFQYLAFSLVALLFPWSWKIAKDNQRLRVVTVILTSLVFVLTYTFISSLLEWVESDHKYHLWPAYLFTLLHSGFFTFVIYGIISGILFLFGVTRNSHKVKHQYLMRFAVKFKNKTSFVAVSDIQLFEANDNYVSIYSNDNQQQLIRQTLNTLEKQLDPATFQRIHRKYIVNLNHVASLKSDYNGGYIIYLADGKSIKMSKSYKDKLKLLTRED